MATEEKAVKKDNKDAVVKTVQLDGQVVLKIAQHCTEALPQLVTGQLLGLDVGQTLEVTDCFPFPTTTGGDEEDEEAAQSYQLEMMRCLRDANVDNNTVGWYQSATLGSFQTTELIETFINYHETLKKTVCLIFDPQRSQRGSLAIKAVRLKEQFIDQFKGQKLTGKELREANISWKDVFVEVPVKIHNSALAQALIAGHEPDNTATQGDYDRLNLSMAPFLEKNLQSLMESVDDLVAEQQKVTVYHKNVARQAQQYAAWLQKRRQENQARRAAGEEPLPEEDPQQFKPIPEPSLLDSYLVTSNMSTFCDQINVASTHAMQKLYVMEALQKGCL